MKEQEIKDICSKYEKLLSECYRIAILMLALDTKNIEYYLNCIELSNDGVRSYLSHKRYSDDSTYEDIPFSYFELSEEEIVKLETERIKKEQTIKDRINEEKLAEQKRQEELREKLQYIKLNIKYGDLT